MKPVVLPEIVSADFKNEWREIPEQDYHKDLSAVARGDVLAFMESPAKMIARRQKEESDEESDALRFGRAAHMLALEPARFRETYVLMPDFGDMRSSKNRDNRDQWKRDNLKPGGLALKEEELLDLSGVCESVLKHADARPMFENGILEKCGYYRDPETGLKGRIKPDCIQPLVNGLFDFKTTMKAVRGKFSRQILDCRYDIQLVKYSLGSKMILGSRPDILGWVCVEKKPPYEVAVYIAEEQMIEIGEKDCRKAMNGIIECMDKNEWPFAQKTVENIGFPYWYYQERSYE